MEGPDDRTKEVRKEISELIERIEDHMASGGRLLLMVGLIPKEVGLELEGIYDAYTTPSTPLKVHEDNLIKLQKLHQIITEVMDQDKPFHEILRGD